MPGDYEATQQASELIAASITATSIGSATTLMTTDKQRRFLSVTSSLNQAVIVTRNGAYWQYLGAGAAGFWDLGSNNEYLGVSVVFAAYAVSATPTSGSLYGMAA